MLQQMKKYRVISLLFYIFIVSSKIAHATSIEYSIANIAGDTWEYSYFISNDTLGFDIEEFTIYFDYGLYGNLNTTTTLADWDELTVNPDMIFGFPEDGFYDGLALVTGINPGSIQTGFSVSFDWYGGVGTVPASQFFEIVNPVTFDVLDSGYTITAVAAVPEPSTFLLLGLGLLSIIYVNHYKKFTMKS